jgi:hypothetical protein
MFDLFNPTPDDLYETLQSMCNTAMDNPNQEIHTCLGVLSAKDAKLRSNSIHQLGTFIREMTNKANGRTESGRFYSSLDSIVVETDETSRIESNTQSHWVTEVVLKVRWMEVVLKVRWMANNG